jgi:hypothetical protein
MRALFVIELLAVRSQITHKKVKSTLVIDDHEGSGSSRVYLNDFSTKKK